MNCEYCRKYFVDSLDGITVYCFHTILHGLFSDEKTLHSFNALHSYLLSEFVKIKS